MPWASVWWVVEELQGAEQELLQPPALPEELVADVCGQTRFHRHSNRPEPQGVQDRLGRGAAVHRIRCRSYLTPQNRMNCKSGHAEAGRKVLPAALEVEEGELQEERTEAYQRQTPERGQGES